MEQVYRKKMEVPIEDMKRFLDGILHIHDEGRTKMSMGALSDSGGSRRKAFRKRKFRGTLTSKDAS